MTLLVSLKNDGSEFYDEHISCDLIGHDISEKFSADGVVGDVIDTTA